MVGKFAQAGARRACRPAAFDVGFEIDASGNAYLADSSSLLAHIRV
jgi:hypothetical protein